jgi:hypothetical protein
LPCFTTTFSVVIIALLTPAYELHSGDGKILDQCVRQHPDLSSSKIQCSLRTVFEIGGKVLQ